MDILAFPIVAGHLGHRSPSKTCHPDAFRRTGRAPRRHQTNQTIRIPQRLSPIDVLCLAPLPHKRFERRSTAVLSVDTDQILQRGYAFPNFFDLLFEITVVEQPGHLHIVHVLDIRIQGVTVIDGNPHRAGSHQT